MHELALTRSMLDAVLPEAQKAHAKKIVEIRLVVGDLSAVLDESIQLYFDMLSKDTLAEGAKLTFTRVPAQFKCTVCHRDYPKPDHGLDCPHCGGNGLLTDKGKEFYIDSIEVENE